MNTPEILMLSCATTLSMRCWSFPQRFSALILVRISSILHKRKNWLPGNFRCSDHSRGTQLSAITALILDASLSIANGLVSTCMPGSRCPLPIAAFSHNQ